MNHKGLLNELCQKKGWNTPSYETKRTGGQDHQPVFTSVVTVGDMTSSLPGRGSTIKEAEQESAFIFLSSLNGEKIERVSNPDRKTIHIKPVPFDVKHVMMIDGENLQKLVDKIPPERERQVIVYYSKHHPLANRTVANHVIKKIAPCTRADGCDIFMSMDTTRIPYDYPNVEKITIFSRDKFAGAVADNAPAFFGSKIIVDHDVNYEC